LGVTRRSVRWNLEHHLGKRVAHVVRTLRGGDERRPAGRGVVIGNGVARLHRVDDDAVVDELERDNARGFGKRSVRRDGVARIVVPVEDCVAGNVVEQRRRAGSDRILDLSDRRQRFVLDLDSLRRITRSGQGLGHDQHDRLANVAHLAERKHGTRRVVPRLAVAADERGRAGNVTETVRAYLLAAGHPQHACHATRRGWIDAPDPRVCHRRAQHEGMRHARQDDVVCVSALTGDQAQVLMTQHGLTDAEFHPSSSDCSFIGYAIVCIAPCHCHS
jgi:hypothetical protein